MKALVVQAEDGRLLNDMGVVKRAYSELHTLNAELLGEHMKRRTNHEALLEALKLVNGMVQKASRLRGELFCCFLYARCTVRRFGSPFVRALFCLDGF